METLKCKTYFVNVTVFIVSFNRLINTFWRDFWLVLSYNTKRVNVTIRLYN